MYYLFWSLVCLLTLLAVVLALGFKKSKTLPTFSRIIIILFIPAVAGILYWVLGSSKLLFQYWSLQNQSVYVNQVISKLQNPEVVVDQLKSFLKIHPHHPKGWYLLGRVYYGREDYLPAVLALQKAHEQVPQNVSYSVAYAQADFFYHDGHLSPNIKKILQNVVEHDKNNVNAINLLAINDYHQGDYRSAIDAWEHLSSLFPVGSKDQKYLLKMIAEAQKRVSSSNDTIGGK